MDVLFVSGDAYIDHPAFGVSLLARLLEAEGYRVGILAQPDWHNYESLRSLGRPRLFAAVSAGAMDSMVNRYTAAKKVRNDDAYTPGGHAGARPDRAVIAYTAALKGAFKGLPVIIGGIEASLRRLAHYDYWNDRVRRSVLLDSKADLLVYGMGERALLEIARRSAAGETPGEQRNVPGTAWIGRTAPADAIELPSFEEVAADHLAYNRAFRLAAGENTPGRGRPLVQNHGDRSLVVNPPSEPLTGTELDRIYQLPFSRLPHPDYSEPIPAYLQIRFSITTHRGCYGGCAFCAITAHQGKVVQSRSAASILEEIDRLVEHPEFRGTISDLGGPTANMYGTGCGSAQGPEACRRPSCLHPSPCPDLRASGKEASHLLREARSRKGVKHAFVASGIRYDLLSHQQEYFDELLAHHVGGLLKIAPETSDPKVAKVMRKPGPEALLKFLQFFHETTRASGRRQKIIPYLIAGHPGATLAGMIEVALFLHRHHLRVEQVQEFTPTPGSLATCLWHTGVDPWTNQAVYVPRTPRERSLQKALLLWHLPEQRHLVLEALRRCGREDAARTLFAAKIR